MLDERNNASDESEDVEPNEDLNHPQHHEQTEIFAITEILPIIINVTYILR
jgi:hypothetical protein